ncbi:MAG: DinB family protein [Actinobacteria bacterium]|nr:DinB family protein [Actinomycetota bacterium]
MDIKEICSAYKESTKAFLEIVSGLTTADLDLRKSDGWSARQVIHHMADSEAQSYARLRRLLAEPEGSIIHGYDEGAWAECKTLGYEDLPIENSLAVFKSVRAASLDVLNRITEADLEKFGMHTEAGKYTLATWIKTYSKHPVDHGQQITQAVSK